ncbi:MAG: zf-HC2 domain-containing protein [Candidatus Limnocylindrales bacterium]
MTAASDDLACIELVELVTDYLEDAVSEFDRERIERHLSGCDSCTAYVEQMRQTIAAAGRLTPGDVPPSIVDPLLAIFRASRRTES